jgi:predicted DsbA family dithiol-disulfide isomerase
MNEAFSRLGNGTRLELKHKHLPFFLYPDMPCDADGGCEYHLPLRWGDRLEAIGSATAPLAALARGVGLEFNFDAEGSNTLDSHRLLLLAEAHGRAAALRESLGQRYFVRGGRLADAALLRDAAAEAGLEDAAVERVLADRAEYRAEVRAAVDAARAAGIRSIPVFVFQSGGFEATVRGSSSVDEFHETFLEIEAYWKERQ